MIRMKIKRMMRVTVYEDDDDSGGHNEGGDDSYDG